ncbi:MAG: amidohydrolase family protein [Rhodospirillales bacterium]|jgi:aminocarboxymuconate-semialdehyde decarboxylase|nr:amidohydrolase [Rhodospirillaceae bacterium]MDP6427116.1 amidohydrolase family protein [Rhodospirillales bacterium]MDP6645719.1 amidohydrolase family protein [Rhodospirillales bacterium]MDP6840981.1 amidohydrolase family protein [Rhodospirillales bacterium]
MRKVDTFNHIFPTAYWDKMIELAGEYEDLGKRVRSVPMLMDMDERFRVMDMFDDYQQILSLTAPPLEVMFDKDTAPEMARIANDGMAEICQKYPDRFPGFTASMPMNNPDAAVAETNRVMDGMGALGIQIFTNVAGRALDNPEYFQIFENASDLDIPIWMHPARGADMADYKDEDKSKYEIWWTFGWPYETSVAQARMVFSGMIDRLENFKIITHHLGGLSPFHSGRTGPGWQFLGDRTSGPAGDEYRNAKDGLKKPHAEYFKDFYADTAVFGSKEATVCGLEYYPRDRVLFASDAPFDPEKGPMYIRETIKILDELEIDDDWREDLYWRNAAKIMNLPEIA